jgi:hypothetical protein
MISENKNCHTPIQCLEGMGSNKHAYASIHKCSSRFIACSLPSHFVVNFELISGGFVLSSVHNATAELELRTCVWFMFHELL